eukprot:1263544-Rhodomonas_salina.1
MGWPGMGLRACYAMSGTDLWYSAKRRLVLTRRIVQPTRVSGYYARRWDIWLGVAPYLMSYAMSCIAVAYSPTRFPVLPSRIVPPDVPY